MPLDAASKRIDPPANFEFLQATNTTPKMSKTLTPVDPPGALNLSINKPDLAQASTTNKIHVARIKAASQIEAIQLGRTVQFNNLRQGTAYIGNNHMSGKAEFLGVHTSTFRSEDAKKERIAQLKEKIAQEPPKPKSGYCMPSVSEIELGRLLRNGGCESVRSTFNFNGQETNHSSTKDYRNTGGLGKHTSYTEVNNFSAFLNEAGSKADGEISEEVLKEAADHALSLFDATKAVPKSFPKPSLPAQYQPFNFGSKDCWS